MTPTWQSDEWCFFDGFYPKAFLDVLLTDGVVRGPCWPNACTFHALDGSGDVIDGKDVSHWRLSQNAQPRLPLPEPAAPARQPALLDVP